MKDLIRRRYSHLAEKGDFFPGGIQRLQKAGYPQDWLDTLPSSIADTYAGCGYVLEEVELSGVKVAVDLGCGAGLDARLVVGKMEKGGILIALDLTLSMLMRVQKKDGDVCDSAIYPVAGDMETLPLKNEVADLVLANASFNLTLNQQVAFREAARILRPGGRLIARELVREEALPIDIVQDSMAWNTSLGGVLKKEELYNTVWAAGFGEPRISHERPFPPVRAVRLEAIKTL